VINLRSLRPFDTETIVNSVKKTNRLVSVEEGWAFAGIGSELAAQMMEQAFDWLDAPVKRVAGLTCRCPMPPTSRSWPCRSRRPSSRPPARSAIAERGESNVHKHPDARAVAHNDRGQARQVACEGGDTVKSGQVICEIETDKATMEVEAVDEGKIGQIVVPEGAEGVK
jgi:acetyl/propionyl-CoA carboxylase alpha subunit